ncbi:hypothetical protein TWF730_008504 [Orbilia blumenaviensis]|uniref:Uncharacterized protein n=1 Tax=Orbilia blumenaviensis TaxID=1796055 RepID=A0AAV9V2J2_9PEZI
MHLPHRPEDLLGTLETYRIWMEVFGLLPNIRTLQMELCTVKELETNIIQAVLTKISTSLAFETLLSLNIEHSMIGHGTIPGLSRSINSKFFSALQIYAGLPLGIEEYYEALPVPIRELLGPWVYRIAIVPPLPRGLAKLGVSLTEFTPGSNLESLSNMNRLIRASIGTIKELRIVAGGFLYAPDKALSVDMFRPDFSSLTKFTIMLDRYFLNHLTEIAQWLPNVQYLAVSDGPADPYRYRTPELLALLSTQEQIISKAIAGMNALKRIRLTWLYTYEDRYGIGIHALNHWPKIYFPPDKLEDLVKRWVKAGASRLEKVVFATEYFSSSGRDDKTFTINILKGSAFEGGWKLDSGYDNNYIFKPHELDISV